jgi:NAD(P)-dependent dehydrogenase (short-subunit alcohol dehydrogenase family)
MVETNVAAVVGVGPGLGAAIARRFGREGFDIALMARGVDRLDLVRRDIENAGRRVLAVSVDATDSSSVKEAFELVRDELGPPNVLVYNAGAFKMGGLLEVEDEEFERCWKANCAGAFYAARQVLPGMLDRGSGTILLTGATGSVRGSARFSCLAVGKFGLRALAQSMAREFGPKGIHVAHVVIDGQIDTPRLREAMPDRKTHTMLNPNAIADTYWQLHNQDPSAWALEIDLRPSVERF